MLSDSQLQSCIQDATEFTEKKGGVTVEFSTHIDKLDGVFEQLEKARSPIGRWYAATCETCVEYYGEGTVHVTLGIEQWIPFNASNLLKLQDKKEISE